MRNVTAYNSQERTDRAITYFYFNGNSNITISDSKIDVYKTSNIDIGVIEIQTTDSCLTGNYPHTVDIINNEFSLTSNPDKHRFNNIELRYVNTNRQDVVNLKNNTFKNIQDSSSPIFIADIASNTSIFLDGNTFTNVSASSIKIISLNTQGAITINNTSFTDITEFGGNIITVDKASSLEINTFKIQNVAQVSKTQTAFIYAHAGSSLDVKVTGLEARNVSINTTPILSLRGEIGKFELLHSVFDGITFGSETSMISIESLSTLHQQNISFANILEESNDATDDYIFKMDTFRLDSSENSTIQDISITNSHVGFMSFNQISATTSSPKQFELTNIEFKDSIFSHQIDLVSLTKIITNQDFKIQVNNLSFRNLEFQMGANMIFLNCQIQNGINFNNLVIDNVKGGRILSSAYKTSDPTPAKFSITNISTTNVSSQFGSLITLRDKVDLEIRDSTIKTVSSVRRGSLITVEG